MKACELVLGTARRRRNIWSQTVSSLLTKTQLILCEWKLLVWLVVQFKDFIANILWLHSYSFTFNMNNCSALTMENFATFEEFMTDRGTNQPTETTTDQQVSYTPNNTVFFLFQNKRFSLEFWSLIPLTSNSHNIFFL